MGLIESLRESREVMEAKLGGFVPEIAIILGSGLGELANKVEAPTNVSTPAPASNAANALNVASAGSPIKIPFAEVPHMKTSTASHHVGAFVCGMLGGKRVICMQGRLHGYEGYTAQEVAYPVWLMHELGAQTLITTNAAGAINENYNVGDLCIMTDHINLTGRNPIAGTEPNEMSFRFFSMLDAYDPALRTLAREKAIELKVPVQEGVYLGVLGPSFETPAEIRAFRTLGADTVAMSVCEEVIAARHVGMRVLGISLCSNMACGIECTAFDEPTSAQPKPSSPNDDEVIEVAAAREADFCNLITAIVQGI